MSVSWGASTACSATRLAGPTAAAMSARQTASAAARTGAGALVARHECRQQHSPASRSGVQLVGCSSSGSARSANCRTAVARAGAPAWRPGSSDTRTLRVMCRRRGDQRQPVGLREDRQALGAEDEELRAALADGVAGGARGGGPAHEAVREGAQVGDVLGADAGEAGLRAQHLRRGGGRGGGGSGLLLSGGRGGEGVLDPKLGVPKNGLTRFSRL